MNREERAKFRKTRYWKAFRQQCRLHTSKDYITKEPLSRTWNLHHLDLNIQRYAQLEDMSRFMPLNDKTHEIIHEIFKWYKKDRRVLDRIKQTIEKMEELTNGV